MPSLSTSPVDPKEMLQDILNAIVTSTDNRYINVINEFNKYLGHKDEIQQKHILSELITYQTKNRIYITARNAFIWPTLRTRTNDPNFPIWLKQIVDIFSNGVQNDKRTINELFCIINEHLKSDKTENEYFFTDNKNSCEKAIVSQGFFDMLKSFINSLIKKIRGIFVSKPEDQNNQSPPKDKEDDEVVVEEKMLSIYKKEDIEETQKIIKKKSVYEAMRINKPMFFNFKTGLSVASKSLAKVGIIKKNNHGLKQNIG